MAKVRYVALFSREIRERLSLAGAELLLTSATRLTEGQLSLGGHYFGSTMLTIDLVQAQEKGLLRDDVTAATAQRLAQLMTESKTALARVREIAEDAAIHQARHALENVDVDIRIHTEDRCVFVDIDVEARAPRKTGTTNR